MYRGTDTRAAAQSRPRSLQTSHGRTFGGTGQTGRRAWSWPSPSLRRGPAARGLRHPGLDSDRRPGRVSEDHGRAAVVATKVDNWRAVDDPRAPGTRIHFEDSVLPVSAVTGEGLVECGPGSTNWRTAATPTTPRQPQPAAKGNVASPSRKGGPRRRENRAHRSGELKDMSVGTLTKIANNLTCRARPACASRSSSSDPEALARRAA